MTRLFLAHSSGSGFLQTFRCDLKLSFYTAQNRELDCSFAYEGTIRYINRVQTANLFSLPDSYEMYKKDLESNLQLIKNDFATAYNSSRFKANFDF